MNTLFQPLHTLYGGADRYSSASAEKLSLLARNLFTQYASTATLFAEKLDIKDPALAEQVYCKLQQQLTQPLLQDQRIDFEDGFGIRSEQEEDTHAERAANELATAIKNQLTPPFIGLRIKAPFGSTKKRALRTLDIFITTLIKQSKTLPENFVLSLPKIESAQQIKDFLPQLIKLEQQLAISPIALEIIAETPALFLNAQGGSELPLLEAACAGRLRGVHFGTYDFLAANHISSHIASHTHPLCDWARMQLRMAFASDTVWVSDSITNVMPVATHKKNTDKEAQRQELNTTELSAVEKNENNDAVWRAWKTHFDNITHSLQMGLYQGWDLHPGQLPMRYAANIVFFLSGLADAQKRMHNFMHQQTQASLQGSTFDDLATARTVLNFLQRGYGVGAFDEQDIKLAGLEVQQLFDDGLFELG